MTAIASIDKCIFLHVESVNAISNDLPALKILTEVSSKTSCPLHHAISSSINPMALSDIVEALKKTLVSLASQYASGIWFLFRRSSDIVCFGGTRRGF
jgi:hypothetical protein